MRRLVRRIARISTTRLLQCSAVLTIVALALMVWSMLQPTPLPVMLAMSVGQLIGTIAFALYGAVILRDLRQGRRARRASAQTIEPVGVSATGESEAKPFDGAGATTPKPSDGTGATAESEAQP